MAHVSRKRLGITNSVSLRSLQVFVSKSRIRTDKTPVHVVLIDHNVYPFIIGLHGKDLLPKCMTAISVIDKMFIKKYWLLSLPCKYLVSIMIHFVYK